MNLGNLKILARAYVKSARKSVISDAVLETILGEGAIDVATKTLCLPANETFDVTADERNYDLTSVLTRYLAPAPSGLWWYSGSWVKRYVTTRKRLDKVKSNWPNSSSNSPYFYILEGSNLIVEPPPNETLSDGFRFHFYQKPPTMATDSFFPLGGSSEIARLSILSEAILLYWKHKALKILGQPEADIQVSRQEYLAEIIMRIKELSRRQDISGKYQGRKIR